MQKTAAHWKGKKVAMTVIEDGRMIRKEFYVAEVVYSQTYNKYGYQLKESQDSPTLYEGGKLFAEKDLKRP
jgi:hypothetical protein